MIKLRIKPLQIKHIIKTRTYNLATNFKLNIMYISNT
jgi:hypothetical protein